jgi:hypothetical protein
MMLLLMMSCSLFEQPKEPLYEAESEALALHERAVEFYESGQYERSLALLNEALVLDDESPELWLNQAISLAKTGDLLGAVQSATRAVALGQLRDPTTGIALYNRACWRLALGEHRLGAQDVMAAVATGSIDPLQAASDPDLQVLASLDEYQNALPFDLPVDLGIDSESYFVGARWEVSFRIESSYGETPSIGSISTLAPIHLVEIVDNVVDLGAHEAHELTYRFVVDGVMSGDIGPFHVQSSGLERLLPSRPVLFLGPEAYAGDLRPRDIEFLVPSALFDEVSGRVVFRENGRVSVREVDREVIEWDPAEVVAIHVRSEGQPVWSGYDATLTETSSGNQEVVIMSGSQVAVYRP